MAMHKRRSGDVRFAKWFLLKFVLPIILTFIGTGAAGSYFVNQEVQRGWDRVDAFRDIEEEVVVQAAEKECRDDHALLK